MLKTFEYLINTGVESLGMVADAEKKAAICAELAKAIAMSGALAGATVVETQEDAKEEAKADKKKDAKKNTKKDALKPESGKGEEAPAVQQETSATQEAPEATVEEPIMDDEWTEEMATLKAEQLELLTAYIDAWGEDYVYGDCLSAMTEGQLTGGENVRPSNIDGFLAYLGAIAQAAQ